MSPDEIFAALATPEGLPREAMTAAGEHREEMIPLFLDLIERLQRDDIDTASDEDQSAFLFVFYLLGEWRDPRAYRPLARLLRHDPDFLEILLGDALTEGTARVIAGVFDGDLQPILNVIEDEAADVFARCQMIDALIMIARLHPPTKPAITDYLEQCFSADMDKPEELWGSWAFAVADLGLEHLVPQVRHAFEQEWVSPEEASFDYFEEQFRDAIEGGASSWFHRSRNTKLIENAIEELSGWYCFSDDYLKARSAPRPSVSTMPGLFDETFERDAPKVGRNDPCPCGSGKKFKKCCLH